MHTHIPKVFLPRLLVFDCSKSRETLAIYKDFERTHRFDQDVNSEVKFKFIYEHRVFDVLLNNHVLVGLYNKLVI